MMNLPRLPLDRLGSGFALDLRSLALLRLSLGLAVALDALQRFADLRAFHTDAGLLPRDQLALWTESSWRWSLHLANGEAWFQSLLLIAQLLAALSLALGWRTRIAAFITWLLLVSVDNRNPLVLDAGDSLFAALLFWGLFLPLGARWSVDSALSNAPSSDHRHLSWASIALGLQVLSVLFFNALLQSGHDAWTQGMALPKLLSSAQQSLGLGPALADHPSVASVLGLWWWWLQLLGPLLLALPLARAGRLASTQSWTRNAVLLQCLLLQLLIVLTLAAGRLPWALAIGLSALISSAVWDRLNRRLARQPAAELRIFYDRDCRFCLMTVRLLKELLILPRAQLLPAQDNRRADTLMRANDSWVVIDHKDAAHLRGAALLLLLARSPLLGWIGRLALRLGGTTIAGTAYGFVARHRAVWSASFGPWLPAPVASTPAGPFMQRIAASLMLLVLVGNLAGLAPAGQRLQAALSPPLLILHLDQRWDSFAMLPAGDRWWVAPGHLRDGREIDVLRPDRPLRFTAPAHLATEAENGRWRLWQERLAQNASDAQRRGWARYLCREWIRDHAPDAPDALLEFRLVEMFVPATATMPVEPRTEQRVRLRQDCTAPA